MFIRVFIILLVSFINVSFAQDWHWERNDDLLNPSGIKTLGMNTPFTGDFDSDDDTDLIVGCKGGVLQYYENIGTPDSAIWEMDVDYFATLNLDTLVTAQPSLVDLDNDGSLELYLETDSLRKYINIGTSEDPVWQQESFNIGYDLFWFYCHQFVDFDYDGDYDLVFAADTGPAGQLLHFFRNVGNSTNPSYQIDSTVFETLEPEYGSYYNYKIADIFGDDKFEVIMVTGWFDGTGDESLINYYRNIGSIANPNWIVSSNLINSSYATNIDFGDFDNDNDLDMLVGNHRVPLFYNENLGNADSVYFENIFNGQHLGPIFIFNGDNICFVDFDNDNDFDFTYLYSFRTWPGGYLRLGWGSAVNTGGQTTPRFDFNQRFNPIIFSPYYEVYLSPGDLNGDGFPELAQNSSPPTYYINSNGSGYTWGNNSIFEIDDFDYSKYPELADFNNDGLTDLLVRHHDSLHWLCYRNVGTTQSPLWSRTPAWIAGIDSNVARYRAAYIDNDDRIDLIGIDTDSHLRGYINTGIGDSVSFDYMPAIFANWQDYPLVYYDCVDIDGDGDDDILVDSAGVINMLENMTHTYIDCDNCVPDKFILAQNYPNPFNSSTSISFALDRASLVSLTIYDLSGRLVDSVVEGYFEAGDHSITWNASKNTGHNLPSGIYFYKLAAGEKSVTRKMIYLK